MGSSLAAPWRPVPSTRRLRIASSRTHGDRRLARAVRFLRLPSRRSRTTARTSANVLESFSMNSTVRRITWFRGRYDARNVAQSSVKRCLAITSQSAMGLLGWGGGGRNARHEYNGAASRGSNLGRRGFSAGYAILAPSILGGLMRDPRGVQLARLIVRHSTELKPGEAVLIEAFDTQDGLLFDLVEAVHEADAIPLVALRSNAVIRSQLLRASEPQLKLQAALEMAHMERVQA